MTTSLWEKIGHMLGHILAATLAAGSIGENAATRKLLKSETVLLDVKKCKLWGKEGIEFMMHCPKAGIDIPLQVPAELARNHAESLLGMLDGEVTLSQLMGC